MEILSGLRDKQTLLCSIVLPLFLYPGLLWCLVQGALFLEARTESTAVEVGLAADLPAEAPAGLAPALERTPDPMRAGLQLDALSVERLEGPADAEFARAWASRPEGPDAVLHLGTDGAAADELPPSRIYYDSTRMESAIAQGRLQSRLEPFVKELRVARARELGRDPELLEPLSVEARDHASGDDLSGYLLSLLLPVVVVVTAVVGAFVPAVDATAGERERGTLETTLLAPIPRHATFAGKVLAAAAFAFAATLANLAALSLSVGHLLGTLTADAGAARLPAGAVLAFLPMAACFALFLAALLSCIASTARSFKEGQALLGPVQLVLVVPALVGLFPAIELTPLLSLVPVVGTVLVLREMLQGAVPVLPYVLSCASLLALALVFSRAAQHVAAPLGPAERGLLRRLAFQRTSREPGGVR